MNQEKEFDSVKFGEDLVKQLINKMDFMDKLVTELVDLIETRLVAVEAKVGIHSQETRTGATRVGKMAIVDSLSLMKIIKERFSDLLASQQEEMLSMLKEIPERARLLMVYEVSNRREFDKLRPMEKPVEYMDSLCDLIKEGDWMFTPMSSSDYSEQ